MVRGQYSEILETPNKPPFDEWWASSKDIVQDWDAIKKENKNFIKVLGTP
jgi:hypothetical protein